MNAYVFPGQGSQFPGMGKDLYDQHRIAKILFESANEILDFDITKIMFEGTKEELKQTRVTQPAIYIYSVIVTKIMGSKFQPDALAGHSLGEFSALAAAETISFDSGLRLVSQRAEAMQMACDVEDGTMAAILGLDDEKVVEICRQTQGVVVAANFNCPGQLVISGSVNAVKSACENMRESGAKRAILLPVGGAFHSPLMEPARVKLANAIENTNFTSPICPVFQNVVAEAVTDSLAIKKNLVAQLTTSVRWTQTIEKMVAHGIKNFIEVGPGKVLQGLIKKINQETNISSAKY
ncbi:MAG: ACP S-malonyltransferase [Flavobacteriaceae bacterium]|tara:strand:+ start:14539 stop:15420 length:882 start_codon:yes stop_codon:yes gene_type:complete